jgi:hypothetical protein
MRPTSLVTRERAVSLVVCGQAQVIAEDPAVLFRSQHLRVALPVILQVPAYVASSSAATTGAVPTAAVTAGPAT